MWAMNDNPHAVPTDADFDPRSLDIPDGLTFGVVPASWRIALSGNKQLVFLVVRQPGAMMGVPMTPDVAGRMAQGLTDIAAMCVVPSGLVVPTFIPPTVDDLLRP